MGQDSPTPKNIHLKIRRRLDVESATILEEGGFKVYFDGCIKWSRYSVLPLVVKGGPYGP